MALIQCPECKKEVSDQAAVCIHCGYPLKTKTFCKINGTEQDLEFIFDNSIEKTKKIKKFRELTNCGLKTALNTIDNILEKQEIPKTLNLPIQQLQKEEDNRPQCPKCGSTNIQVVPRKWSLLTGFITNKTDRVCVNCKHKF